MPHLIPLLPPASPVRRAPPAALANPALPGRRVMYRALMARDPRYEGVFYAGVKTTGIFCRPTCRAKKPRAANVEFYASISAALHAGYRPYRLCRPLDKMLALADRQCLRLLEFVDRRGLEREIAQLRRRLHCAVVPGTNATLEATEAQLRRYFSGEQLGFDLPLAPVGSAFQQDVWAALRRIPAGTTRSYAEIAAEIGRTGAQRAVGRANGSNLLSLVIPCHRVIASDGTLSGYGGGVWRKQRLLDHERTFSRSAPGRSL